MKAISIRELHANTGRWVRKAAQLGEVRITDHGRLIARILPESESPERPYFARRKMTAAFKKLDRRGAISGGTDSTKIISEDREERQA